MVTEEVRKVTGKADDRLLNASPVDESNVELLIEGGKSSSFASSEKPLWMSVR